MFKRKLIKIAALLLLVLVTSQQGWGQSLAKRYTFTEPHLGTLVTLTCYHSDSLEVAKIANSMFALLGDLNLIYSDYEQNSEVKQLNNERHKGMVPISVDLNKLLVIAEEIVEETGGAFDPYLGRLTHRWKKAFRKNRWPGRRAVRRALKRSGHEKLRLVTDSAQLMYQCRGIEIDLGGIGKGYIGDRLADYLDRQGISQYLIDLGGDLIAGNPPPHKEGWRIGLASGHQILIAQKAIATSGTTYQYLTHRGRTYSHLINPGTGYGLGGKVTSTVIAPSGAEADALASALPFLEEALREKVFGKEVRAFVLTIGNEEPEISKGMREILKVGR